MISKEIRHTIKEAESMISNVNFDAEDVNTWQGFTTNKRWEGRWAMS